MRQFVPAVVGNARIHSTALDTDTFKTSSSPETNPRQLVRNLESRVPSAESRVPRAECRVASLITRERQGKRKIKHDLSAAVFQGLSHTPSCTKSASASCLTITSNLQTATNNLNSGEKQQQQQQQEQGKRYVSEEATTCA
ncbi:hypothetical protein E2C01_078181 [Portunus trituberculatus]|uniref:Uncharacterized protein n=1 Tax=Portunus trituberculatus TaxID=210409 RepID=A0A5B7IGB0_PORTR|nr:hypothetical protein [Portunus trituberculatus]